MASPGQYSARLKRFQSQLEEVEDQLLADSQLAISQRSAQTYMQRDRIGPRDPDDTGPLRIQTDRLVRSLTGAREGTQGRQEGISRVRTDGTKVLITIGTRVPYAATHEYGDPSRNIPRRSYLRPALDDETDTIRQIIDDGVIKALRIALSE